ncbi:MAG: MBL fold metallo-hydrolase [Candidatus Saliniplasma sp.]
MRIRWHGHSCFEIENDSVVVTDPHDGKNIGIKSPNVKGDIILVSHDHFDHNAVRLVEKSDSEVIEEDGEFSKDDVSIRGIEAYHDTEEGKKRGKNIIYTFEIDGIKFCHLGDLGHGLSDEMIQKIKPVDFLFIPVGDTFTIGPKKAADVVEKIRPSIAVPMHYKVGGLSLDIKGVIPFLNLYPEHKIHKVGVELDFLKTDLPEETEVWVFSL